MTQSHEHMRQPTSASSPQSPGSFKNFTAPISAVVVVAVTFAVIVLVAVVAPI